MAYKVIITASAESDLEDIVTYVAEDLDNLPAAAKLLDEIEERYTKLAENRSSMRIAATQGCD